MSTTSEHIHQDLILAKRVRDDSFNQFLKAEKDYNKKLKSVKKKAKLVETADGKEMLHSLRVMIQQLGQMEKRVKEHALLQEFDRLYEEMSEEGKCDSSGGAEYTRVREEWIESGYRLPISSFIYWRANCH
jgi:hypothetical protein